MTRVWLRQLYALLHDLLADALGGEPGVTLVGPPQHGSDPSVAPDVVIGMEDPGDPDWAQQVLRQWPHCRVLLVEQGGHRVSLFELRPYRTSLGEMSVEDLVEVVKAFAQDSRRHTGAFSTGVDDAGWDRRTAMNEQGPKTYDMSKGSAPGMAELVAAVLAIQADLRASRPGAPAPQVQKAINAAGAMLAFYNQAALHKADSPTDPSADLDEFLQVLNPDTATAV